MTSAKQSEYTTTNPISGEPLVDNEAWVKHAKLILKGIALNSVDQDQLILTFRKLSNLFRDVSQRRFGGIADHSRVGAIFHKVPDNGNVEVVKELGSPYFTLTDCIKFEEIITQHNQKQHNSKLQDGKNNDNTKFLEYSIRIFNAADTHFIRVMDDIFNGSVNATDTMKTVLADYAGLVEVGQATNKGDMLKANQCLLKMDPDVEDIIPRNIVDFIHANKPATNKHKVNTPHL